MFLLERLRDRLAEPRPAFVPWCVLPEPSLAGLLAREDFDAVVLDMQHGLIDVSVASRAIPLVAAASKPAIVRIPVGDFATASRALDWGASGIIAPMINSVEDAARLVAFTKFPPIGERSWGPLAALTLSGLSPEAYFAGANAASLVFAMIETREAMDRIDAILAVPGLDGVFIGPADLSIGLSGGAVLDPFGPPVMAALDEVLAACRRAGKLATIFGFTPERAQQLAAMGFALIAVGLDTTMLREGAQAALRQAKVGL